MVLFFPSCLSWMRVVWYVQVQSQEEGGGGGEPQPEQRADALPRLTIHTGSQIQILASAYSVLWNGLSEQGRVWSFYVEISCIFIILNRNVFAGVLHWRFSGTVPYSLVKGERILWVLYPVNLISWKLKISMLLRLLVVSRNPSRSTYCSGTTNDNHNRMHNKLLQ